MKNINIFFTKGDLLIIPLPKSGIVKIKLLHFMFEKKYCKKKKIRDANCL